MSLHSFIKRLSPQLRQQTGRWPGQENEIICVGIKNETLAKKYLITGCILSFCLSSLYSIIIYGQSENISIYILKEEQCAPLLRLCSLSFPFAALHSCFNGYYYGKKKHKTTLFYPNLRTICPSWQCSFHLLLFHRTK